MNLELENKEKRKETPLTKGEWLAFFFVPVNPNWRLNPKSANQIEFERFKKYGFEKKVKQAEKARISGILFYLLIVLIVIIISNF